MRSVLECTTMGRAMNLAGGRLLGISIGLSISGGAASSAIVAPDEAAYLMGSDSSAVVLPGLTLPATVWIVLAGLAALVYLIRHRH